MSLGQAAGSSQVRTMGFYRDKVTGVDMVFAGVSGTQHSKASLGLMTGAFDKDASGRLAWASKPELKLPAGERFMEFTECNGVLYASSSRHIWKRTDGPNSKWIAIFEDKALKAPVGVRGLATVQKIGGVGEDLLFITWAKIRRLDPNANNKVVIELDMPKYLSRELKMPIRNALAGYNKIVRYRDPSGRDSWVIGFQCNYDPKWIKAQKPKDLKAKIRDDGKRAVAYFAIEARYLVRTVVGGKVAYAMRTILDPARSKLGAVRTIAASPFPEDKGRVLYLGGVDCNGIPHHDTGWMFRVEVK